MPRWSGAAVFRLLATCYTLINELSNGFRNRLNEAFIHHHGANRGALSIYADQIQPVRRNVSCTLSSQACDWPLQGR